MTEVKNPAGNKEVDNPFESEYDFELAYESGNKKKITLRRVSTEDKLTFGMFLSKLSKDKSSDNFESDMALMLFRMLCPEILSEVGDTPTYGSLGDLTALIIQKDGKTLFGDKWDSVSDKIAKAEGEAKNPS